MKTQDDLLKEMVKDERRSGLSRWNQHPWLVPVKMPITKIEAFDKQFPWVRDYISGPIVQAYVSGLEADLIGRRLSWVEKTRQVGLFNSEEYFVEEVVHFLDENFKLMTSERPETYWARKYRFMGIKFGSKVQRKRVVHFDGTTTFSIKSALEELGDKGKLVRVLLSYWEYTQAVIIYKLPKGDNLKDWVDCETEAERVGFERAFNES